MQILVIHINIKIISKMIIQVGKNLMEIKQKTLKLNNGKFINLLSNE